jgi:uncharacterized membrane protein YphA (DoxX/SURF4 family)
VTCSLLKDNEIQVLFHGIYAILVPGGALVITDTVEPAHPLGWEPAADAWDEAVRERALEHSQGERKETEMNTGLWVLQIALCLKFVSTAYTHGFRRDQAKWQQGMERFGAAGRPLLALIAILVLLGGVGLILPAATGVLTWLTPLSAAVLAVMMLVAVGFHVGCRETPNVVAGLVLFALAAFVAYGRWVIAPF